MSSPPTSGAVSGEPVWSIGLYRGDSPLSLRPAPGVSQPVLSAADVSDVAAGLVADPFLLRRGDVWHMFFEVMNAEASRGEIGLATSPDGRRWTYRQIVLREPHHLSYPHVFEWQGEVYMLPEHPRPRVLRLYRATDFPTRWTPAATLLEGRHADASLLCFAGRWWLFAGVPPCNETLNLYFADRPTGPWRVHPRSPIVRGDARIARPAGRMLVWRGLPLRFTQDCLGAYGQRVRAFRITRLTPTEYREQPAGEAPILEAGSDDWNHAGMHHVDAQPAPGGGWIACVDGQRTLRGTARPGRSDPRIPSRCR